MTVISIDEVLGLIGFGWIQLLMIIACALASIYLGNEILGISAVSVDVVCEFSLEDTHISLVSSAGFFGMVLGSYHAGYLTDLVGRRKVMLFALIFALIASFISILMPEFYCFIFFRFIVGLFLAGAGVNNITYMSEFIGPKYRAGVINLICYAFACSAIWVPFVGYFLSPLDRIVFSLGSIDFRIWRHTMLIHIVPGIFSVAILTFLPETAKFMLADGQEQKAYDTLNHLYKRRRHRDLRSIGITGVNDPDSIEREEKDENCCKQMWRSTVPLFRRPLLRNFLICTFILCGFLFVGNGISLWFLRLRASMGHSEGVVCEMVTASGQNQTKTKPECPMKRDTFINAIELGCGLLGCCILITILLMFMRRSHIQLLCAGGATICGLSLNFVKIEVVLLIAMVLFSTLCASCIPVISSLLVDLVPTHIRGMAINMSFMFARLAVVLANVLLGLFMMSQCIIILNLFVVIIFLVAVATFFLPKGR